MISCRQGADRETPPCGAQRRSGSVLVDDRGHSRRSKRSKLSVVERWASRSASPTPRFHLHLCGCRIRHLAASLRRKPDFFLSAKRHRRGGHLSIRPTWSGRPSSWQGSRSYSGLTTPWLPALEWELVLRAALGLRRGCWSAAVLTPVFRERRMYRCSSSPSARGMTLAPIFSLPGYYLSGMKEFATDPSHWVRWWSNATAGALLVGPILMAVNRKSLSASRRTGPRVACGCSDC